MKSFEFEQKTMHLPGLARETALHAIRYYHMKIQNYKDLEAYRKSYEVAKMITG